MVAEGREIDNGRGGQMHRAGPFSGKISRVVAAMTQSGCTGYAV
jgi:hypothetical protein